MSDTPRIEKPKKELTEAEKAAQIDAQKTTSDTNEELESAKKTAEERREAIKKGVIDDAKKMQEEIKVALPPENVIKDPKQFSDILKLKIEHVPRSVPAFLDALVEQNPKLLDAPGIAAVLATKIQDLLKVVSSKPELSHDRDWMDSLRKSINHLIINPSLSSQLQQYGTMDEQMRKELQKDLGINEKITEGLDENTREIVQRVHTGFYRFDAEVNTWVNSVGALVFLWPENIAGIKKYLTAVHPDHPFLKVTNYHSNDKAGKYAIVSDGQPHNMMLAESDYLVRYLAERGQGKDDAVIFDELGKNHVAHLKTNAEVTKSVKEFEKKYGKGSYSGLPEQQLYEQSRLVSRSILSHEEYAQMRESVGAEQYELVLEKRPEMKDIITDIVGGFIRFNRHTHTFQTVTNEEIRFTKEEFQMIQTIFEKTHPDYMFLHDKDIPTYSRDNRKKMQYNSRTLRDRILFYQQ